MIGDSPAGQNLNDDSGLRVIMYYSSADFITKDDNPITQLLKNSFRASAGGKALRNVDRRVCFVKRDLGTHQVPVRRVVKALRLLPAVIRVLILDQVTVP